MRSLKIFSLLFVLTFFCLTALKSQNNIDSLLNTLAKAKNPQQKALISYKIARASLGKLPVEKTLAFANSSLQHLGSNIQDTLTTYIFILKAEAFLVLYGTSNDSANYYLNRSEKFIATMSQAAKVYYFYVQGSLFSRTDPPKSIKFFLEARKLCTNNKKMLRKTDVALAHLYLNLHENVKSNKIVLNLINAQKNASDLNSLYLLLSGGYTELNSDSCIYYTEQIPETDFYNYFHANLLAAQYLTNNKKNLSAEKIINKLKKKVLEGSTEELCRINKPAIALMYSVGAEIKAGKQVGDDKYSRSQNLISAINDLKNVVKIYMTIPNTLQFYRNTSITYNNISNYYIQINQTDSALYYYKLSVAMNDSLEKIENSSQSQDLLAKYDTEKKNSQIVLLNEQNKLSLSENKRQRFIIVSSIVMGVLFLAGLLIFINRNNLKQRANKILSQQKQQIVNAYTELSKRNNLIEESIEYAAAIQQSILTNESALKKNIPEYLLIHLPKEAVGGDFYWLHKPENSPLLYLAVADCTGHGVPGSLMTLLCNNIFNQVVEKDPTINPAELLTQVNSKLYNSFNSTENPLQRSKDGMDVSLICLNEQTRILTYAGARNPILLVRKGQDVQELKVNRYSIGYLPEFTFEEFKVELQKDDVLYLHTDGYIDQAGANSKTKFLKSNLLKLVTNIQPLEVEGQKRELLTAFNTWKSDMEQTDDVCLIAIKV